MIASTAGKHHRWRALTVALIALCAVAPSLILAGQAGAASTPTLSFSTASLGCAGGAVGILGSGFPPNEQFTLTTTAGTLSASTLTSDNDGILREDARTLGAGLDIPLGTPVGTLVVVQAHPANAPSETVAEAAFSVPGPYAQLEGMSGNRFSPFPVGGQIPISGSCFWPDEQVKLSSAQVQLDVADTPADRNGDVYTSDLHVTSIRQSGQAFITLTGESSGLQTSVAFADSDDTLNAGTSLDASWSGELVSPSTHFQMLVDGTCLVVAHFPPSSPQTSTYDPVWQASQSCGIDDAGVLTMQSDGNLVLYNGSTPTWSSGTYGTGSDNRAVMQDDGNLVIYTASGNPVWSSRYGRVLPAPPTTLMAGHVLSRGQSLANGRYSAALLTDGNFVVHGRSRVWSTRTAGHAGTRLIMQSDGNLVLYTANNKAVWSSGTYGSHATRLVMQSDGNLVLYTAANRPVWSTQTN